MPHDFDDKIRLSDYIKGLFPYLETGSASKKAFQKNQIKVNSRLGHSGDWVLAGSEISYNFTYTYDESNQSAVEIYYEDNDLMIVRKPPGLSSSGRSISLQQCLESIQIEDKEGSLPFPYLAHRLDKATEGIMIAAKNINTRRLLGVMMEKHAITKHYVLIVKGSVSKSLNWIEEDLDGKSAKTEFLSTTFLNTKDPTTKVFVRLHTGRKHQIRRHFSNIGHPIIGDNIYNNGGLTFGTGLLLCAYYIEFTHPVTNVAIKIEYPIPRKIDKYGAINNE